MSVGKSLGYRRAQHKHTHKHSFCVFGSRTSRKTQCSPCCDFFIPRLWWWVMWLRLKGSICLVIGQRRRWDCERHTKWQKGRKLDQRSLTACVSVSFTAKVFEKGSRLPYMMSQRVPKPDQCLSARCSVHFLRPHCLLSTSKFIEVAAEGCKQRVNNETWGHLQNVFLGKWCSVAPLWQKMYFKYYKRQNTGQHCCYPVNTNCC